MYDIGSVIIIKNIIFKNGDRCYDHSYKKCRPCLVVALTNDKVYFLTLASNLRSNCNYLEFIGDSYTRKKSAVNIESIYCRDTFYYEEICKIDNDDLLRILLKFYDFQTMIDASYLFLEIKDSIEETFELLREPNYSGRVKCKIPNN